LWKMSPWGGWQPAHRHWARSTRSNLPFGHTRTEDVLCSMTTPRLLAAGAILALVSFAVVLLRDNDTAQPAREASPPKSPAVASALKKPANTPRIAAEPASAAVPARESLDGQPALVAPQLSELSTTESPDLANRLGAADTKPEAEAKIVLELLRLHRRLFGAFPAGENNSQFVNALLGANKTRVPLLPHDHPRLNAGGELVDAWGTPFFFHQNSHSSVEVRSAGADRLLYTDDDIVAGKKPPQPGLTTAGDDQLDG
jgi:hypothetical protein